MNRSIFSLTATLALAGGSHAAILVDNFNSYGPVGTDMNGQGGWSVTHAVGPDGPVAIADSYTWDLSSGSATVGGVAPADSATSSTLSHSASQELVSLTAQPTSFSIETSYTESTGVDPRNNFQFVLGTTAGDHNLLTINFTPDVAGQYNVNWNNGFGGSGYIGQLVAGAVTAFRLDTWTDGTNVDYALYNAGVEVGGARGVLTGATSADLINSFGVTVDTSNGVGSNSITIDNLSIVPEPSATLLCGLAGLGAAFRRKRA